MISNRRIAQGVREKIDFKVIKREKILRQKIILIIFWSRASVSIVMEELGGPVGGWELRKTEGNQLIEERLNARIWASVR